MYDMEYLLSAQPCGGRYGIIIGIVLDFSGM